MTSAPLAVDRALGGVSARELAATYGTPLFVIDLDQLDLDIDRFLRACAPRGIAVAYAGKAFLCAAFAEHLAGTPLRLDVCSLGELLTAERGGFPAGRMYFHGCGKTEEELSAIVDRRVAFDVIDNAEELERLAALASASEPVDVMLRLKHRDRGAHARFRSHRRREHEVRDRARPLRVGLGAARSAAAAAADRACTRTSVRKSRRWRRSRRTSTSSGRRADRRRARVRRRRAHLRRRDRGRGRPRRPASLEVEALAAGLAERAAGHGLRLAIEPGRALVARAGSSLYRVMAVKIQGRRRFVVVDGGWPTTRARSSTARDTSPRC